MQPPKGEASAWRVAVPDTSDVIEAMFAAMDQASALIKPD
jgi:hypothetical protein